MLLDSNLKKDHIIFVGLSQSLIKLRITLRLKTGGKAIMANLQSHISMEDQSNLCTTGNANFQCSVSHCFCKCYSLLSLKQIFLQKLFFQYLLLTYISNIYGYRYIFTYICSFQLYQSYLLFQQQSCFMTSSNLQEEYNLQF